MADLYYRLTTLGDACLWSLNVEGERVVHLRPGKCLALVVYLALSHNRRASRDHLLDLLWSNRSPDRASAAMRQVVWQLRGVLGKKALSTERSDLALTLDVSVDRDDFVAAARNELDRSALELYTGPFLRDFAVPGGSGFEDWAHLERMRLQSLFIRASETVARDLLQRSRFRQAVDVAACMRDAEPMREGSWRLLLQSLVSSGDKVRLELESDELQRMLVSEGRQPEPATRQLLDVVRDSDAGEQTGDSDGTLVPELIGRAREFSIIVHGWAEAQRGLLRHIHTTAHAGLGKTRLLGDTHVRLRAMGATTVFIRANSGARSVHNSLAGDIVEALGRMPGAKGVAPASVDVLLDLAPSLSSSLPSSGRRRLGGYTPQQRIMAVSELFLAVAEEQPIAVMVDDLHWSDSESFALLGAVLPRLDTASVLVVTTARPIAGRELHLPMTEALQLQPLDAAELEELVASLGMLQPDVWSPVLTRVLSQATGGSPQLVLETLRFAMDKGLLELRDGVWICPDVKVLERELTAGSAQTRTIEALDVVDRSLLTTLAVAGIPLELETLIDATRMSAQQLERSLAMVEQRGLVAKEGSHWEVSHDGITDVILGLASEDSLRTCRLGLGRAFAGRLSGTATDYVHASRHLLAAGAQEELDQLFRSWVAVRERGGDARPPAQLAHSLLGDNSSVGLIARLVRSLPWWMRSSRRVRRVTMGAAVGVTVAVATTVLLLVSFRPRPERLVVVVEPLSMGRVDRAIVPAPVVEVQNARGDRVPRGVDSVSVALVGVPGVELVGQTTVAVSHGRAVFDDIRFPNQRLPGTPRLSFQADDLDGALSEPLLSTWSLRMTRLSVNGEQLDPTEAIVTVPGSAVIEGTCDFVYSSPNAAASIIMGYTPTWGEPAEVWRDIGPLVTPVREQTLSDIHFSLTAPSESGTYHIVFAFGAETAPQFLFSATNWVLGEPVWGDGNDIVDWTAEEFAEIRESGVRCSDWLFLRDGKPGYEPNCIAVADIEVNVTTR